MPSNDPAAPPQPSKPAPIFVIASWLLPVVGALITTAIYSNAVAHRSGGDWLPGIGEALIGIFVIGVCAFGCGLTAILRRERNRWLAVLPFLAGLVTILYYCRAFFR